MGLFCANFHFRSTDDKALSAALVRRGVDRARVLDAKGGWISLYEERASQQDDDRIRELAGDLSRDLGTAAIAFMVHDSDVACYWLFDNGELLDEYNSCPGYFDDDDDEAAHPSGGKPEVLLRYCRAGVRREDIDTFLGEGTVFAEDIVGRIADAVGIDRSRALADYREAGGDEADDDSDDDSGGEGLDVVSRQKGLMGRLAGMFGLGGRNDAVDPQVQKLVNAAANNETDEIDRLLDAGVAIDGEGPAPLAGRLPTAGIGKLLPGGAPTFAMTPLLAAVVNKRRPAVEKLLAGGADPNRAHPLFGSAVHAAAGAGDMEILQMLLDRGGDVNATNPRGETPLKVIATGRGTKERMAQAQALMKSMGAQMPGLMDEMAKLELPTEGWDACERLLKERGGRQG